MESDTNITENYSVVEDDDAAGQPTVEANSDQPPRGKVRSIITQFENSVEPGLINAGTGNGKAIEPRTDADVPAISVAHEEKKLEESTRLMTLSSDGGTSRHFSFFGSLTKRKSRDHENKRSSCFYSSPDETETSPCDFVHLELDSSSPSSPPCPYEGSDSRPVSIYSGSSDFGTINCDTDSLLSIDPSTLSLESDEKKAYFTARELVTSEADFIRSLKLLQTDFRNFLEHQIHCSKAFIISMEDIRELLKHLPELLALNEDLYEDLKARVLNWENHPKIADVIVKKGAFLKIYATYIQDYSSKTQFLDECCIKYPKFAKIVNEFQSLDQCRKLTIKHYMLKPVQRIPQYRLLLSDYLKRLNESSLDYEDTVKALAIVSEVNDHLNNRLKREDKVLRLVQLQSMLSNFTLIEPGRELIKDGPLQKVCRKTVKDRYFILLNDCLIYSTPSKTFLNFQHNLALGGMKVTYSEDDSNLYTFKISSTKKSFILCAKSEVERKEWVEALQNAIDDYAARRKTFMNEPTVTRLENFQLGKEAPLWIQDGKVTMCQVCTAEFTHLFRRHHCRACGRVICSFCGDYRAPLQYKSFKAHRVCDNCFDQLLQEFEGKSEAIKQSLGINGDEETLQKAYLHVKSKFVRSSYVEKEKEIKVVPHRLKEVTAKDSEADVCGWLRKWKTHRWKTERHWFVLKNRVLYMYGASEDIAAYEAISVLGYTVVGGGEVSWDGVRPELVFQLTHDKQLPIVFATDSQEQADRWLHCLTEASKLE